MSSTFVPAAKRYHGILKQQGEGCLPEEIAFGWAHRRPSSQWPLKRSSTASRPRPGGLIACDEQVLTDMRTHMMHVCMALRRNDNEPGRRRCS